MAQQVRTGTGFGELELPGDEPHVHEVEAALAFSYNDLDDMLQARWRLLGAFAPDASFRLEAAALVWECSKEEADDSLTALAERGLVSDLTPITHANEADTTSVRWQQHSLLRAYALGLLRRESQEMASRAAHARAYNTLMRETDDRQIHFVMLPDYAQLQHAFTWAIEKDLVLAQALASNTANLQAGFYLVRDNYTWAEQLAEATANIEDEGVRGGALLTLGNALQRLANLPGEDRRQHLLDALAAYDQARRPDTAPLDYAMTQGNLSVLHRDLARLPEEDPRQHWKQALECSLTTLSIFIQLEHATYTQ